MSFWKEAGKSFVKYSEKIVEKTEEYTKIAKLILDIKKLEHTIETLHCETGEYVIKKLDEGGNQVSLNDDFIRDHAEKTRGCRDLIASKRKEIEDIKAARNAPGNPPGGSGAANNPR